MSKKLRALEIEERLFVYMLMFGIVLGGLNIINNIIIGFPFVANYKWILLMLSSAMGGFFTFKEDHTRDVAIKWVKGIIFFEIIFIFLPNGWIYTGGVTPSTMAYVFLICIAICFVCEGIYRIFFVIAEIIVIIILLFLAENYPFIFVNNPTKMLFWDNIVQIPTTLIAASILLIMFSNAFRKEQKMLNEYSEMLIQKNQTLFQMTIKDELTTLYNRRYIFEELQSLWRSLESQEAIRLALVDVDNFKMVNDTYGHVVGDRILKNVADIMLEEMSGRGFAGRYGGDEFVLVFIGSDIENVMKVLDDMNLKIKSIEVEGEAMISLSGGVSRLTKENNVDAALSRADDILYQSKKTTKGRIVSDEILNRI